jgi:hypothetical protein
MAASTFDALLREREAALHATSRTLVRVGGVRLACRPLATRILRYVARGNSFSALER